MRHVILSVVLAFGLGTFACSDDDPDPVKTPDTGATQADKGTTTPDKGTEPPTDHGVTQEDGGEALQCDPAGSGKCTNADDCALLDTPEKRDAVTAKATACGMGCLDPIADAATCSAACMADGTTGAGLTADCSGCYVGILLCVVQNCIAHCVPDSSTENCIKCQNNEAVTPPNTNGVNCLADFYTCSGLPVPTE